MKLTGWSCTALVVGCGVFAVGGLRGGCANSEAPDEQLADHFEELCEIASDNIEEPKRGVIKLGRYMGRHLDDMMGDFGATIVEIEKISDDDKHDRRAELARKRMHAPWIACERKWVSFWQAVEDDPEASEIANHASERLGRTLEIIFSSTPLRLRDLPTAFAKRPTK
ncbi:MAG TPA: hypothetical protein VK427_22595 [Kofleriaceae bacterium]|nr:hypothetical protein [Kofleriaceae bacterium]